MWYRKRRMRRRAAPPNRRRRRRAGTSGSSARRGAGPAPRRGRRTNSRETSRETADRARTGVDPCKSIFMNDDAAGIGGRLLTAHSHSVRASFDARLFALRAWRGSVARRATCVGAIAARAHRTALAHGIHWHPSSPLSCVPPWCPARTPGAHMRGVPLSLSRL